MPRSVGYFPRNFCYTTEVSSIIWGHHVYMSVRSSAVDETLNTKPDNRDKVKDFEKFAIGVYKRFICLWVMYQLQCQVYAITFSTIMNKTSWLLLSLGNKIESLVLLSQQNYFFKQKKENLLKHWKLSFQRGKTDFQLWLLSLGKKEHSENSVLCSKELQQTKTEVMKKIQNST